MLKKIRKKVKSKRNSTNRIESLHFIYKNKEILTNIIILIAIILFIFSYFNVNLLLKDTITSGGDTASHFYPAKYMKETLLPQLKMDGWSQGWYGGFPIFQFYFPLPFVLMSLIPLKLTISFKLVTILGTLLLPLLVFLSMKKMNFKFPTPIVSAILTLPFLFMEANSMWGGNIPSTLAGEFSYSISLALTFLFLGFIYKDMGKKKWFFSSALFALVTLTHVYTAIFAASVSIFFLLVPIIKKNKEKLKNNFLYLFKTYFLAFLLTAFWLVPLITNLHLTTPYADSWGPEIFKIFPLILTVFAPFAIIGILKGILKKGKKVSYILFFIFVSAILFLLAEPLGIVDIRFVAFLQISFLLLAAYGIGTVSKRLKGKWILSLIVLVSVIIFVNSQVTYIDDWAKWNYEGFENKPLWNEYKQVNDYLKNQTGRVVYEHNQNHNRAGTPRAFESLPLFAKRPTLEGLYMQSSITAPFVFYIQAEVSKQQSCPFWKSWECDSNDVKRGSEHLKIFNVKHFIARTNEIKTKFMNLSYWKLVKKIDPFWIFETNNSGYVTKLKKGPILKNKENWKRESYNWFKNANLEKRIVFNQYAKDLYKEPKDCSVSSKLKKEEILINTTCINNPLVVSVSYHPRWKVKGGRGPYLISPSFMLIYPTEKNVRMYYGRTSLDNISLILSIIGLIVVIYLIKKTHTKTWTKAKL